MRLFYNEIAMKILIVDDEEPIRELIKYNVEKQKYETFTAENGQQALELCRNKNPDLVILDLMLPDICRIIRNDSSIKNIPIIMVTAKTEDSDIVTGLELGADDYVTKPFSPKVLLARIQSVLRRKGEAIRTNSDEDIKIRSLVISPLKHKVMQDGKEVELSATEFSILEFLARHKGQVFSRQQIINAVKGSSYPVTDRSIDVQILGIRKKIGDSPESSNPVIETLRGVGYRICEE